MWHIITLQNNFPYIILFNSHHNPLRKVFLLLSLLYNKTTPMSNMAPDCLQNKVDIKSQYSIIIKSTHYKTRLPEIVILALPCNSL